MFSRADVLAFTHTGYKAHDDAPDLEGFHSIYCKARTYEYASGGLAVYVRKHINAKVVDDMPHLGMVWLKLQAKKKCVYACVCYIPPDSSSYFKLEDGRLSKEAHWECLQFNVSKFSAMGEIIILGDLNARTGVCDDRYDERDLLEWNSLSNGGVEIPHDAVTMFSHLRNYPCRNNCDSFIPSSFSTSNGGKLLDICRSNGLLILNGRLPGDLIGEYTFSNTNGQSTIDYFVASPSVVYHSHHELHKVSKLCVESRAKEFKRDNNGKYDHFPVILTIDFRCSKKNVCKKAKCKKGSGGTVFKWDVNNTWLYNDILLSDLGVKVFLDAMHESEDVDVVEQNLRDAVVSVIQQLHNHVGGVVVNQKRSSGRADGSRQNTWYNDACREARQRYVLEKERRGAAATTSIAAYREYKRVVNAARRAWEDQRHETLLSELRHDSKRFWKSYNRSVKPPNPFSVDEWTECFNKLFKSSVDSSGVHVGDTSARDVMFPLAQEDLLRKADDLNADFTEAEIVKALKKAANGKSAGVDGISMEFYKYAFFEVDVENGKIFKVYTLASHITRLFNVVLKKGYPKSWAIGALTPVPKPKGNPDIQDDYRGIAVGGAISKLYSMVMLQRMDQWAEQNNHRARGQAGFRHGRGTPDNAFVLQHIIEKYRDVNQPVYAAFIDFRKAYDCICRPLLWECMRSLGMHGQFLDSLISMYKDVKICVRVDGVLGACFDSEVGVKQGDPLSSCLFGLFIDRLEKVFNDLLGQEMGVRLKNMFLKVLLYADDLVLLAESATDLQAMLDVLSVFCRINMMTVNIKKSEVVIFNSLTHDYTFTYDGHVLDIKDKFIYLGMLFEGRYDVKQMARRGLNRGRNALFALYRKCAELDIHNVYTKLHLFDTLVKPILNYGCEIWGPSILSKGKKLVQSGFREELEILHRSFLRHLLGIRKSVPDIILMCELRREPLVMSIIKQFVNFWNRVQSRPSSDLVKIAMMENCELAKQSSRKLSFWAGHFNSFVGQLCDIRYSLFDQGDNQIDTDQLLESVKVKWCRDMCDAFGNRCLYSEELGRFVCSNEVPVRSIPNVDSVGFKARTYLKWFYDPDADVKNTFWYNLHRIDQISVVSRFRMGSHWLNVDTGRYISRSHACIPRDQRLCTLCSSMIREDELHMLECAIYDEIRGEYGIASIQHASVHDDTVKCVMNNSENVPSFWKKFSIFLLKSIKLRVI